MSRYKVTYRKHSGSLFSGEEWNCYITDRKTEKEYSGYGHTKNEAKDKAWDLVYSNNSDYTELHNHNPNLFWTIPLLAILCGLAGLIIGGIIGGVYSKIEDNNFNNIIPFALIVGKVGVGVGIIIAIKLQIDFENGK